MRRVIARRVGDAVQYTNGDGVYYLVGCTNGTDGEPDTLSLRYPEARWQRMCSVDEKVFILASLPHPHYYHRWNSAAGWWQMHVRSLPPAALAERPLQPDKPVTDAVAVATQ